MREKPNGRKSLSRAKSTIGADKTGTDAAVATVLENTLGGTVVWSYIDTGEYLGTLAAAFVDEKTTIFIATGLSTLMSVAAYRDSENAVGVVTAFSGSVVDELLSQTAIEIRVYP